MLQGNPSPARLEAWAETALADAAPKVLWLDDPARPEPVPRLPGDTSADLVVGGGYTGLWTALRAKERDTGRDVVVLEAGRCGEQASGRNGGFASASLTHGFPNGLARWPYELAVLDELGSGTSPTSARRYAATASTAAGRRPASFSWRPRPTSARSSPVSQEG